MKIVLHHAAAVCRVKLEHNNIYKNYFKYFSILRVLSKIMSDYTMSLVLGRLFVFYNPNFLCYSGENFHKIDTICAGVGGIRCLPHNNRWRNSLHRQHVLTS
jgi:hypothetical protein